MWKYSISSQFTPWLGDIGNHRPQIMIKIIKKYMKVFYFFVILPLDLPLIVTHSPVDTGCKLNVHKTFRRCPGRLLNVLCTFILPPVSAGRLHIVIKVPLILVLRVNLGIILPFSGVIHTSILIYRCLMKKYKKIFYFLNHFIPWFAANREPQAHGISFMS